jgi:four helix bundle protein
VGAIRSYRDLDVWSKSMDLVELCYRLSDRFPRSEEFGLKSQVRRSSVSIPSNIAEGNGRAATREYLHFVSIAHGSLMELETQWQIAGRLQYVDSASLGDLLARTDEIGRMLTSLARRLREKLKPVTVGSSGAEVV